MGSEVVLGQLMFFFPLRITLASQLPLPLWLRIPQVGIITPQQRKPQLQLNDSWPICCSKQTLDVSGGCSRGWDLSEGPTTNQGSFEENHQTDRALRAEKRFSGEKSSIRMAQHLPLVSCINYINGLPAEERRPELLRHNPIVQGA